MSSPDTLLETLRLYFKDKITECILVNGEPTIEVRRDALYEVCTTLRNDLDFSFDMLVDLCGVDYQQYGSSEWVTDQATQRGFDRGVTKETEFATAKWEKKRFAVVWHLLSLKHNHRLRLRAFTEETQPVMDSVVDIWPSANWYEREAFDLYGICFTNHPDLRRLLTDYGFEGHPFRKDFPMIGETEVRYDKIEKKVIYEPVQSVTPRTVIPKVIRSSTNKSNEVPFNDN